MKVIIISIITSAITSVMCFSVFTKNNLKKEKQVGSFYVNEKTFSGVKNVLTPYEFFGESCQSEIKEICPKKDTVVSIANCLKGHTSEFEKMNSSCDVKYARVMSKYVLACKKEINTSCKDIILGGGRLNKCLSEQNNLSESCRVMFGRK